MIHPVVVPQWVSGPRIKRPQVIWDRDEQHAIHKQGRAFDDRNGSSALRSNLRDPVNPSQFQPPQIGGADLRERAVTLAGVVSVEGWPTRDWRFADRVWVNRDDLGVKRSAPQHHGGNRCTEARSKLHFSVSR